jgi:hypothetical protein
MNTGQFKVRKRAQKDYTLAFKLQVVDEVEKGELSQDAEGNTASRAMLQFWFG